MDDSKAKTAAAPVSDDAETNVDLPAAGGGAPGGIPPEWLETPEEEARDLADLIAAGHRSAGLTSMWTVAGVALVLLAFSCYYFDRMPGASNEPFERTLERHVALQAERDYNAYRHGPGATGLMVAEWPMEAQRRSHEDAFLAAGLALLIGFVFLQIERAKLRRQDLLVYRALAREVEKLRMEVRRRGKGED